MRRSYIFLIILQIVQISVFSQTSTQCIPEAIIDSVHYYSPGTNPDEWIINNVQIYNYTKKGLLETILKLDYETRTPIFRQTYSNYKGELPGEQFAESWMAGSWTNSYISEYRYYPDKNLKELVTQQWRNNAWLYRSKRIYLYNIFGELDTMWMDVWRNGMWEEFSFQDFVYSPEGQLVEMDEFYSGEDEPWRRYEYSYNEFGLVKERIILIRENDELENYTKYLYHYGNEGFLEEFIIQKWNGEKFINSQRRVYFSSISGPRKVLVCHNGHTICISIHALPAHLAHGDHIGRCDNEASCKFDDDGRGNGKNKFKKRNGTFYNDAQFSDSRYKNNKNNKSSNSKSLTIDNIDLSKVLDLKEITVYPNPVLDFVKIDFLQNSGYVFNYLEITDMGGRQRKVIPVKGLAHLEINCTDLENGIYFIRFVGKELKTQKLIINR